MPSIKVVTGYVLLPTHPRSQWEYVALGRKLAEIVPPIRAFYQPVKDLWLLRYLRDVAPCTHATGDNPEKNTMAYHAVQHQKTDWMLMAAQEDKDTDVFVWVDYGICHMPNVTVPVIEAFLDRAAGEKTIAIPGCWGDNTQTLGDFVPNWRFCGSVLVCHRDYVAQLAAAVKDKLKSEIRQSRFVTWEVNTWAKVERDGKLPIRWYSADHNETMFTNY